MKIPLGLWERVTSYDNLDRACRATLAGGRALRGEGAVFQFNRERLLMSIQASLVNRTYRHGAYRSFTVFEPKERIVLAAPLRDRVVHHALHDVVAPLFDRGFIFDSYACRNGKGTHRAIARAHSFLRAHSHFIHLDVRKYFPSIPHQPLKRLIRRSIKEEPMLWLFDHIIDSTAPKGRSRAGLDSSLLSGLPIGNLTSQFLANLYLNELDQFVKHILHCRAYVRYMDDFVLFHDDVGVIRNWYKAVTGFCATELGLLLHEKGGIKHCGEGLGFLGFRIFENHRRLKSPALNRFVRRARARWVEVEQGKITYATFQSGLEAWRSHASYGDTHGLLLSLEKRYPMMRAGGRKGE